MDCETNLQDNLCYDETLYEFTKRQESSLMGMKTVWYVLAHKHLDDGSTAVFEYPYNKGRFDEDDYAQAPGCPAFWDWYKGVTTAERKSFREHWMWHMFPKRPMSINQYRDAIKERTIMDQCIDCFAHTEPTKQIMDLYIDLFNDFVSPATPQQIGINPMRSIYDLPAAKTAAYTTTATTLNIMPAATATVSAQTDIQQQRGYLMERLEDTSRHYSDKYEAVRKAARAMFNIDTDNAPKSLDELMTRLAAKDFTIDATKAALQAKYDGSWDENDDEYYPSTKDYFYALTWNGPKADRLGYEAQIDAFKAEIKKAKDAIMIQDPATGLTALQTLEAWQPTGPAN